MDLYLDTNMIYEYFENIIKGKDPPKVFRYLYNEYRNGQCRYFVSNLTKIEIFRHLHGGFNVSSSDCHKLWIDFVNSMGVGTVRLEDLIGKVPSFFDDIAQQVAQRPSSKTMIVNIIHCKIAREIGSNILTGDLKLKEKFEVFYPNITTYTELRGSS